MATRSEVIHNVITPLEQFLGEPKHANPAGYYDVLHEVLEEFTAYQLECAVKHLKKAWRYKSWPSPAEVAKAAEQYAPAPKAEGASRFVAWREGQARKRGTDLRPDEILARMVGNVPIDAAEQGWATQLWEYVRVHGEIPFPRDEQRLRADAAKLRAFAERVLDGEWMTDDGEVVPLRGLVVPVKAMAKAVLDREAKRAEAIRQRNRRH